MLISRFVPRFSWIHWECGFMPDLPPLTEVSALAGSVHSGRYGCPDGSPGVTLVEIAGLGYISIAARGGKHAELEAHREFACQLPQTPYAAQGRGAAFLWFGPARWLARAERSTIPDLLQRLSAAFADKVSVADLSDAYATLGISGARVRDALAKLYAIDLHPRQFHAGDLALTGAAHMPTILRQLDERPEYELAVPRSFAHSFVEALLGASAEFGCEVAAHDFAT
jgi:sarcosine oxidase subunit gamma